MGALDGVRVVDLTRYLSGPTLTMLLADLGADVVKVETLPTGDPARQSGPFSDGESVYYMASNRNKRSVALDLRSDQGAAALRTLISEADVFVQNFKPGTAEKMGVGPAEMLELNPRLVYVSLSGFGQKTPGSELAGFDQTAQAMSGLMSVTGTPETGPLRVGIAVADSATGVFGAVGVLAALHERERTGRGTLVEGSLMQSMLTLLSYQAQKYLSLGVTPGQDGNDHPIMFPQGTFRTGDTAMTLACGNEKMWQRLCDALDRPEWARDVRFASNADRMAHRTELRELIEEVLATGTTEQWLDTVGAAGVPCGPVLTIPEALEHPITAGLDMVAEVDHATLGSMRVLGQSINVGGTDSDWLRRPAPMLGQHTEEVLTAAGYSPDEIDLMIVAGHAAQWRRGED
ncbi:MULTISPECIES: CaiB/BaiF CoA transferase family protein [Pseudonocardia]|uniref:Formyl-coenzyme A transferase n=2 Tax=Pseudonocardia TaxID=1847 RepID=A0A1Y2MMG1_PSEAH|nr:MULTISPECIES: CoA transferase [Pseudonocardia]OSY36281.1 Formyl-coenzyme A transferase [Pseudonocardia autotrophica]TDN73086.1 CoA:oxalate CoA-transferase [Pseudonocardia autotrophica]BBG03806.1 CoA transferase [Pseudonocardia autotrophica]GEC26586.1 CoA transferase [Pseudonocardia saturnea]